ncbi:nSTAND3 domain-containing NTPase [Paraburkholderia strydomiana]
MSTYDFKTLSDQDFEELVCDLMERHLKIKLQLFARGRDGGVDLRNSFEGKRARVIVQCKHYASSTSAQLLASARKERRKLDALDAGKFRYYFVTSQSLSVGAVDKLANIFSAYVDGPHSIVGREMLNRLLAEHDEIETRHFKLWLTSTSVLQKILSAKFHTLTFMTIDDVRHAYQRFVAVPALSDALQKLEVHGHVILTGIPGAGKTTLAHVLAAHYMEHGYRAVSLAGSLSELLEVLSHDTEAPQIILYDDFLGESALQVNMDGQASSLLERIIRQLELRPKLRLVFTTREYILAKAREISERFNRMSEGSVLAKAVLSVEKLDRSRKARILYNHLYYSKVPEAHIRQLVEARAYEYIIGHRHFNPRLVEEICKETIVSRMKPKEYIEYVRQSFDNPEKLWDHAFQRQLDEDSRLLCYLLLTLTQSSTADALKSAFVAVNAANGRNVSDQSFLQALRVLEGTFIQTGKLRDHNSTGVTFHNPSVKDYVAAALSRAPIAFSSIVRGAVFLSQLHVLCDYRDVSHEFIYRSIMKRHKSEILVKAYQLSKDKSLRPIPVQIEVGHSMRAYSTRVSLPERGKEIVDLHVALNEPISEDDLRVLTQMVTDGDAPNPEILSADFARFAVALYAAEQARLLPDDELRQTILHRLFEIVESESSACVIDNFVKMMYSLDDDSCPETPRSTSQAVEQFFLSLESYDFDDAGDVSRMMMLADYCDTTFSINHKIVFEHLGGLARSIPEETHTHSERSGPPPELTEADDSFDIPSAFRSLLPE